MSSISKYRLEKTDLGSKWDEFVADSPSGTIFITSRYLNNLNINAEPYYCLKSDEIVGGFLGILDDDGKEITGHDYVIYDGIIYRDFSNLNRSQRLSEEFKVQQAIAEFIVEKYSSARMSLHHSIVDVRPLLWVNYHSGGPVFHPDIRYTSVVGLCDFHDKNSPDEIQVYQNASVARRQEIRYAKRDGVVTAINNDVDKFVALYEKTMQRQDVKSEAGILDEMRGLVSGLVKKELAFILETDLPDSGETGSMAVILLDGNTAYYLFGANDPEFRNNHTGTAVLWDSFFLLHDKGCSEIDLEGVNSPARGWFKTSFGGRLQPYFSLSLA